MRLALDATPLLGQRSGVGRYVTGLVHGLGCLSEGPEVVLTLFSIHGRELAETAPRTRPAPRRIPARVLRPAWDRFNWPPVELLTGRIEVFHGTNFVMPPTSRARGVVTVHDLAYLRYRGTITGDALHYPTLVEQSIRRGAQVVAVSHAMAAEIAEEYSLPSERITVAQHGVDAAWSTCSPLQDDRRRQLGLPENYILFTGNLEPRKNLGTLVRAHAEARRIDSAVPPLVLAGPAGWGDRWQDSRPDPENVFLAGYLSDEDLRATVTRADAVCMPSHYEGFGLPVLEALAAGRRVLASDIPAHREVAEGTAQFVAPADQASWSEALLRLQPLEKDAVAAARARARQFTWERSARAHLDAYSAAAAT